MRIGHIFVFAVCLGLAYFVAQAVQASKDYPALEPGSVRAVETEADLPSRGIFEASGLNSLPFDIVHDLMCG
jgi:hypothetical protein